MARWLVPCLLSSFKPQGRDNINVRDQTGFLPGACAHHCALLSAPHCQPHIQHYTIRALFVKGFAINISYNQYKYYCIDTLGGVC